MKLNIYTYVHALAVFSVYHVYIHVSCPFSNFTIYQNETLCRMSIIWISSSVYSLLFYMFVMGPEFTYSSYKPQKSLKIRLCVFF